MPEDKLLLLIVTTLLLLVHPSVTATEKLLTEGAPAVTEKLIVLPDAGVRVHTPDTTPVTVIVLLPALESALVLKLPIPPVMVMALVPPATVLAPLMA